jgi:hypothetical protein
VEIRPTLHVVDSPFPIISRCDGTGGISVMVGCLIGAFAMKAKKERGSA